ncbi:MAG: hypothetical protein RI958_2492 [Actinomycetota bacterium]|jgi:hypothetical protein
MSDDHTPIDDETAQMLEHVYVRATRIEPQLRRFSRVLADLGLPVPADWASQDDLSTVSFADLTVTQFDRLLCLFEDLAANRPISVTVVRGGPTLFDPGPPSGPVSPPSTSSVHMVVPR